MRRLLLLCWLGAAGAGGAVAPVAIEVPQTWGWVGGRIAFFVELRSPGSFAGSASFDLPEVPGALIVKVGSPVVSSRRFGDESWFVQTHEFALFTQHGGRLDVPGFAVRFARRDDFVGTPYEVVAATSPWHVEVRRPPGSAGIGYLISTPALDVEESWQRAPQSLRVGDVLMRTITQRAEQVPGMALAPLPSSAPDGVRAYPGSVEVRDALDRGEFVGQRRDTVRYLLTAPGTVTLPGLTFVWWNPAQRQLLSRTLPPLTVAVADAPVPTSAGHSALVTTRLAWGLGTVLVLLGLGWWQRRRILRRFRATWRSIDPPERAAARRLLRACRRDDRDAAEAAWHTWRALCGTAEFDIALRTAVIEMQQFRYGRSPGGAWRGRRLAGAVREFRAAGGAVPMRAAALPPLNP